MDHLQLYHPPVILITFFVLLLIHYNLFYPMEISSSIYFHSIFKKRYFFYTYTSNCVQTDKSLFVVSYDLFLLLIYLGRVQKILRA